VRAEDLRPEQLERLKAAVGRELRYLTKLVDRMEKRAWDRTDPVYHEAWEAYRHVHSLSVHLQYASCPKGTAGK
jgi:hypothetical protein